MINSFQMYYQENKIVRVNQNKEKKLDLKSLIASYLIAPASLNVVEQSKGEKSDGCSAMVALWLRHGCAMDAPWVRHGCAMGAL